MKRILKGLVAGALLLAFAGCSTVPGIIIEPYDGQVIENTSPFTILVQPDQALNPSYVEFYIDGEPIGSDPFQSGESYSIDWDTSKYSGYSSHKIKVLVYDISNNLVQTEEITVYVDNN